jgi:hypothetical protein
MVAARSATAVLRDQPVLFGQVASTSTAWRILDHIDEVVTNRLRAGRALARERLWAPQAETVGPIDGHRGGGRIWPGLRIMLDALVTANSDKQLAAETFKGGWGNGATTR